MTKLTEEDVGALRKKPPQTRLKLAIQMIGARYEDIASQCGITRAHLAAAAQGRQSLSLTTRLLVAREIGVPAAVLWPWLEEMALEVLHGK